MTQQKFQQLITVQCYSQSTKDIYMFHVKKFLSMYQEEQENILSYLEYLVKHKNYKASSVNLAKYALIYYFKEVLQQKMIVYLPKIKRAKSLPKCVDVQIIQQLLENTNNFKRELLTPKSKKTDFGMSFL